MTDLASLVVRMQADNSQYIKALDQASAKLKKYSDDTNSLFSQIKDSVGDLAGTFAAAFATDKIVEFSAAAIEAQASIAKMSQETGISVDKLSTLNLAFAENGLSADQTATAMKKLGQAVSDATGDPTSKAGLAFKLLGISIEDLKHQDLSTTMQQIAKSFSGLADGPNKTAIAIALMGRQGQQMIPFLNEGAAGFDAIAQSAKEAGANITDDMAQAAEELERKLNLLKAEGVQGLGNAIALELIPTLNNLADAWSSGGGKASAYQVIAEGIGTVFKGVAYVVLELAGGFVELGNVIGATAAAAGAAAEGDFAAIPRIFTDLQEQNTATIAKFNKMQDALFVDNADKQIAEAKRGAAGAADAATKPDAGSLKGAEVTAAADKELQKYAATMREQTLAFGLGAEASARFKLETGSLGEAMEHASDVGKKAAAQAVAYAHALQIKKDEQGGDKLIEQLIEQGDTLDQSAKAAFTYKINTGELGASLDRLAKSGKDLRPALEAAFDRKLVIEDQTAVQKMNDELDVMNGKLVQAAQHQFDLANKGVKQNLTDTGDTAGLAKLDQLRQAETAQAQFNEQEQKATQIEQQYATAIAQVNLLHAQGAITDLQAQRQEDDAQKTQIANLQQVYTNMKAISDQNPQIQKLAENTQNFSNQIVNLKAQTSQLEADVRKNLESAFADNFSKLISGAESFRDFLKNMLKDVEKMFIDMIAKDYAQKLFAPGGPGGGAVSGIAGIFGGGGGSGGSGIASLFSGFFADGGSIAPGKWGIAGENGPEPVYGGSSGMQVHPSGSMGGHSTVNTYFSLPQQGGTISRQTQSQAATEVARRLAIASRRAR